MDKHDLDTLADSQGMLAEFLKNDVILGITFACLAKTEADIGSKADAKKAARHAREAYDAVKRFLPRASTLDAQERKQIKDQLEELKRLLVEIPPDPH
jgi:hypothetical protein